MTEAEREQKIAKLRAERKVINKRRIADRDEARRLSAEIRELEGPLPVKRNRQTQFRIIKQP